MVVRGYEGPLELPGGFSIDQLCRLLRRFPSTNPDVMARHLARSTYFGRRVGGVEHEMIEFALRVMAATERVIGGELGDVYRDINMVQSVDYARRALDDFRNGLMSQSIHDDGSSVFERASTVQRVMEESPESPDAFIISSDGE